MAPRKQLSPTFPHRCVLCVSVALCVCGLASIVLAVLGLTQRILGYYWATGFWCGAVVLLNGISGLVCTQVRDLCSTKTFMIASICGGIASLAMSALSAGGIDVGSGFYDNSQPMSETTAMISYSVHGTCLGLGIMQLSLCILSDGICVYYIFVKKGSTMFRVKDNKRRKNRKRKKRGNRQSSVSSRTPLCGDTTDNTQIKAPTQDNKARTVTAPKPAGRRGNRRNSAGGSSRQHTGRDVSPTMSSFVRSSSFSTFGHGQSAERESLIVHPGDDMSIADTVLSRRTDVRAATENHYAQTALFGSPLPIEEDDQLPPYELVDSNPYENTVNGNRKVKKIRGSADNSAAPTEPSKGREDRNSLRNRQRVSRRNVHTVQASTRTEIPHGRLDGAPIKACSADELERDTDIDNPTIVPSLRHSRSADLLDTESESVSVMHDNDVLASAHSQGVLFRDFARSRDVIENPVRNTRSSRTQSLHVNREKRTERRKRALSAEIRLNKDEIISQGRLDGNKSTTNSSSGLFADSRIKPTKFSLRRPVRQIGIPVVRSPIPVCSITSLPLFTPPTKPPRIHSYTADDFRLDVREIELDAVKGEDCPFMDVDNTVKADVVHTPMDVANGITKGTSKQRHIPDNEDAKTADVSSIAPVSTVTIDAGPVVELKISTSVSSPATLAIAHRECNTQKTRNKAHNGNITSDNLVREVHESPNVDEPKAEVADKLSTSNFMEIPLSPTLKKFVKYPKPQVRKSKLSSTDTVSNATCTGVSLDENNQTLGSSRNDNSSENIIKDKLQTSSDNAKMSKQSLTFEDMHALKVKLPVLATISKVSVSPLNDRDRQRVSNTNNADECSNKDNKEKESAIKTSIHTESTAQTFGLYSPKDIEYNGARPKTSFRKPFTANNVKGTPGSNESGVRGLSASPTPVRVVGTRSSALSYKHAPLTSELTFESRHQLSLSSKVPFSPASGVPIASRKNTVGDKSSEQSSTTIADMKPVVSMKDSTNDTPPTSVSVSESSKQCFTDTQTVPNTRNSLASQRNESDKKLLYTPSLKQIPSFSGKLTPSSVSTRSTPTTIPVPVPSVRTSGVVPRPVMQTMTSQAVPVVTSTGAPPRTHPQGVLHLPQSQHSRHMTDSVPAGVGSNHPPQRVHQNHAQPNVNQEPNKPLFSVLL